MVLEWIWGLLVLISVVWVIYDVFTKQKDMKIEMKILWTVVALVLGIIGAIIYYFLNHYKKK